MNTLSLLNKYSLSAKEVTEFFNKKLLNSISKDKETPEEFKQFMLEEGFPLYRIADLINVQPRTLFDFFDEHDVIIEIIVYPDKTFSCKIGNQATTNSWKTRVEAEVFSIEAAFEILEKNLEEKNINN